MSNGIKAWSWSRYADYCQCPAKAKYKHVQRLKEPGSAAMNRGAKIHDILAEYVTNKLKALPKVLRYEFEGKKFDEPFPNMKFFQKELTKLRAAYRKGDEMTVEDDWAFTRAWRRTAWDNWTDCWVRMKLDLAHLEKKGKLLVISDWKSGRSRSEEKVAYEKQLQLYAVAGLIVYPEVDTVLPRLVFVDAQEVFNGDLVSRDQLEALKKEWVKHTAPMFLDTIFAPLPNNKCRWCHYRKANQGPCKF